MIGEQAQAVAESVGVAEVVGWIALCAVVAAFVAWGLTKFVNRKWLKPWKARLLARAKSRALAANDPPPDPDELLGWYWTGVVGSVSVVAGSLAGLAVAAWPVVPLSLLVGAVVGLAAGLSPVWIVKLAKRKAAGAAGVDPQ